jgi:5-methylcytosine-specific restriction endonuclease McrA
MPTKLARPRAKAFASQQGLCIYCRKPVWLSDIAAFSTRYSLTTRQARWFQCTAEHLTARQDGGGDSTDNIAAACLFCNRGRHQRKTPKSVSDYLHYVQSRIARGGWNMPLLR